MLNEKATMIPLIVGLIKKIFLYKNDLFSTYSHNKNKIEFELDLTQNQNQIKMQQNLIL